MKRMRRKKPPRATRASLARQVDVLSKHVRGLQEDLKHAKGAEDLAKEQHENVMKAARQHFYRAETADAALTTLIGAVLHAVERARLSRPEEMTEP